ncbi:MAG: hypothetical protein AB7G47_21450 [Mycolicibacterium sp.]|uniref:hypothetical protein n=1 Tax=Mycolicibacterium sp. TaxID=2320850 RepID=UPI003D12E589
MSTEQIELFRIAAIGGFICRQPNSVERVLQFMLPDGDVISIGLTADQLRATQDKLTELAAVEMETGETMRDLGLYEGG